MTLVVHQYINNLFVISVIKKHLSLLANLPGEILIRKQCTRYAVVPMQAVVAIEAAYSNGTPWLKAALNSLQLEVSRLHSIREWA